MTPAAFARLALSFEGAVEQAHGGHPDFRAGGKVFASMGYPNKESGVVKLTPEQQEMLDTSSLAKPTRRVWILWLALIAIMITLYLIFNGHH